MAQQSRNWGSSSRTQDTSCFSFGNDRFKLNRDDTSYERELLFQQKKMKDNMISALQRGRTASEQSTRRQEFSFDGSSQGMPSLSYNLDLQSQRKSLLERELQYLDQVKREHKFLKIANSSADADCCSQKERQFLDRAHQQRKLRERINEVSPRPLSILSVSPVNHSNMQPQLEDLATEIDHCGSSQGMPSLTYNLDLQSQRKSLLERELEYLDQVKREDKFLKIANSSADADCCSQKERQFLDRAHQERELRERINEVPPRPLLLPSGGLTWKTHLRSGINPIALVSPVNHSNMQPQLEDLATEIDHLLNRIAEMNDSLNGNQATFLNMRARSPSPPSHFNVTGENTNTQKQRAPNKLEKERHVLIQRLLKISPDYVPPKNYVPCSFVKSVPLPMEEYPEIKFRDLIGGCIHAMEQETGTKMRLSLSNDCISGNIKKPVYLEIKAPSPSTLTAAENLVMRNIEMILHNNKTYVNKQNRLILDAEEKGCKVVHMLGINPEISSQDVCNLSDHIRLAEVNLPNTSPKQTARARFSSSCKMKETLPALHDIRLWGPNRSIGVILFAYDSDKRPLVQPMIKSIVPNFRKLTSNCTEVTSQDEGEPDRKRPRITRRQLLSEEPFILASLELAKESFQRYKFLTQKILSLRAYRGTTEEQVRNLAPDVQHIYPKIKFHRNQKWCNVQLSFATPQVADDNFMALRGKILHGKRLKVYRTRQLKEKRWARLRHDHISSCNGLCLLVKDVPDPLPLTDYEKCFPEAQSVALFGRSGAVLRFEDVETAAQVFRDGPNRELSGGRKFVLFFKHMGVKRNGDDEAQEEDGETLDDGIKEETADTDAAPIDFTADY